MKLDAKYKKSVKNFNNFLSKIPKNELAKKLHKYENDSWKK